MNLLSIYFKKIILKLIRLYQKTLSFDHSWLSIFFPNGYCRFQPTCSEYAYQAIDKYGVVKGGWLGLKRIVRCNPFNKGGEDPLPYTKTQKHSSFAKATEDKENTKTNI